MKSLDELLRMLGNAPDSTDFSESSPLKVQDSDNSGRSGGSANCRKATTETCALNTPPPALPRPEANNGHSTFKEPSAPSGIGEAPDSSDSTESCNVESEEPDESGGCMTELAPPSPDNANQFRKRIHLRPIADCPWRFEPDWVGDPWHRPPHPEDWQQ